MFAKGPIPGATPKQAAVLLLPTGTRCSATTSLGITGYVVTLPDGRRIASAGNAQQAWEQAREWALRNPTAPESAAAKKESVRDYPELECPICERLCKPTHLNKDCSVTYSCPPNYSKHYRRYTWRISEDGSLVD